MEFSCCRPWLLVAGAILAGCNRTRPEPLPFAIVRTSPELSERSAPVLLNDALTIYFSEPVQPLSVTTDSVTLVDEAGHKVPGGLRVGANWVTFQPVPPLSPDLGDGSFQPGAHYRLLVAGSPRPDAVRAADGRRLVAPASFPVRVAGRDELPPGLLAPLRPPSTDLPFLLRTPDLPQQLPADAARLQLHFTRPLLPASVVPDAFEVLLFDVPLAVLVPRSVRVVNSRLDDHPGSTVEIDLGAMPRRSAEGSTAQLSPGDLISVSVRSGPTSVCDYAGERPLPAAIWWQVIGGGSMAFVQWPSVDMTFAADDRLAPCFEARSGVLRPRVRVEAGDGSLGLFRPTRDTTLRPGQPFDRGDGEIVVSRGTEFQFLGIDVPEGIVVHVDAAAAPVQIRSCGGVRIAGRLDVAATTQVLPLRRRQPVRDLAAVGPVALVAAGDIEITGQVRALDQVPSDSTCLLLASAGTIHVAGELPFQTMLAVEAGKEGTGIQGTRGQSVVYVTHFTYGVAPGADLLVRGASPWRQLPPDRDGGVVHLTDPDPELQVAWQATPAHPVRQGEPDLTSGRPGRLQPVGDRDPIAVGPGAFVRFEFTARVRGGQPVPRLSEVRLCDR